MSIKSSASALGFVAAVMVMLTGCGDTTQKEQSPAKVTAIAGSSVQQVQLTERAIQRLGIATKPLQVTISRPGHPVTHHVSNREIQDDILPPAGNQTGGSILAKLGVRDRTQAALKARELGII